MSIPVILLSALLLTAIIALAAICHRWLQDRQALQQQHYFVMEELAARLLLENNQNDWIPLRNNLIGFSMDEGSYACVTISFDSFLDSAELHHQIHQFISQFRAEAVTVYSTSAISMLQIACILHGKSLTAQFLREFADYLNRKLQKLQQGTYIAISDLSAAWTELPVLYSQCQEITDYMQFAGWSGSICTHHDLPSAERSFNTTALKALAQKLSNLELNDAAGLWHRLLLEDLQQSDPEIFRRRRLPFFLSELAGQLEKIRYINGQDAFDDADLQTVLGTAQSEAQAESIAAELFDQLRSKLAEQPKSDALEDRIMCYMQEQFANPDLTVALIAEHFGLSLSYLSTVFKRQTGKGVLQYLHQLRIREAAQLLRETDLPVKTIAERVGYSSNSTLLRSFTRLTGLSPQAYRTLDPEHQAAIRI